MLVDKVFKEFRKLIPRISNPFDECRKKLNIRFPNTNMIFKSKNKFG